MGAAGVLAADEPELPQQKHEPGHPHRRIDKATGLPYVAARFCVGVPRQSRAWIHSPVANSLRGDDRVPDFSEIWHAIIIRSILCPPCECITAPRVRKRTTGSVACHIRQPGCGRWRFGTRVGLKTKKVDLMRSSPACAGLVSLAFH